MTQLIAPSKMHDDPTSFRQRLHRCADASADFFALEPLIGALTVSIRSRDMLWGASSVGCINPK